MLWSAVLWVLRFFEPALAVSGIASTIPHNPASENQQFRPRRTPFFTHTLGQHF
jgi:hypothetical protein